MHCWKYLIGVLVLAMLLGTQPSYAQTTVVISNCTNDSQLRQAVSAPGTSQISFHCAAGAQTITIDSSSGFITVQGNVTLNGAGTITLDGNNATGILQVFSGASLDLRNITLQRGSTSSQPAIENFGTLTLDGVTLSSNQGGSRGAAVTNYKNLVVRTSNFTNNSAAAGKSGGAIRSESGTIMITGSSFTGNKVLGNIATGGAIALNNTRLDISGTSFRGNSAFDGGAIWFEATSSVAITNTLFIDNQAGYGGAIESQGALDIDHSSFSNNRATNGDGGALWITGSDADIAFSTFSNNQATTTGGAISCYANTVSLVHSTVNSNRAGSHGGGIYSTCNVNLTNSTLSANTATKGGGAIYQSGAGNANIAAATIVLNTAQYGAGVYNDGAATSSMSLSMSMLTGNTPDDCGGVLTSGGDNLSGDTSCAAFTQPGDKKSQSLPLGPLTNNGGPTFTHLPRAGNPAINAVPAARCGFSNDQRDAKRPVGANCDIGAVEAGAILPMITLPFVRR